MNQTVVVNRAGNHSRRRTWRVAVASCATALCAVFLTAGASAGMAAAAPAVKGVGYTLTTGNASFTADHHTWHLQITAGGGALGSLHGTATITFEISTSVLGGTEEHFWVARLPLAAKDFTLGVGGRAVLSTRTALAPVAKFSLTFKPTSHAKASCTTGSGTDYSGSVSGSVSLTTGLHGVKVSKKLTFAKTNSLSVESQCVAPLPCDDGGWVGGNPKSILAGGVLVGTPGRQRAGVTVEDTGVKTASTDLVRTDGGYVLGTAKPVFSAKAKTLTITGKSSGLVTGDAIISHATLEGPTSHVTCFIGKQKYAETEQIYVGTFTASPKFEAHTLLTGEITVPASASAFFTNYTYKKA
jgi:hypothetical protein